MLLPSIIETRGDVTFPEFTGERAYMVPFLQAEGLPSDLSRWQPTVDAMLEGIESDQPIYIMIDQGVVRAGAEHRRAGLHIDGYWDPGLDGRRIAAHRSAPPETPAHRARPDPWPRHPRPMPPGHRADPRPPSHGSMSTSWGEADFSHPEGIILASSVSAARGLVGTFQGPVGEMGDCSHVDVSGLDVLPMLAGVAYAGNVACLHESLPVEMDCRRTLVRLNVPGWTPEAVR